MRVFCMKRGYVSKAASWGERGATAVEFAIIFPVLILFLFGIIELSILLFDNAMINHSVRVGARTAALYKAHYSPIKNMEAAEQAAGFWCQNYLITFSGLSYAPDTYLSFFSDSGAQVITQDQFDAIGSADAFRVRLSEAYPYSFLVLLNFIGLGPVDLNTEVLVGKE